MKRIMMAAVALICMTISLVFFSACHSEKTTTTELVEYSAVCRVSGSGTEELVALGISGEYGKVIESIVSAANGADVSDKIIAACDKVYESHSKYTTLTGTVTITKTVGEGEATTLKVYTYPYSK